VELVLQEELRVYSRSGDAGIGESEGRVEQISECRGASFLVFLGIGEKVVQTLDMSTETHYVGDKEVIKSDEGLDG
jgi:hypothetical protein